MIDLLAQGFGQTLESLGVFAAPAGAATVLVALWLLTQHLEDRETPGVFP